MNMISIAEPVNILMAFGAGVLIFFNPCILPLVPSYIMMLTGVSADDIAGSGKGKLIKKTLIKVLLFSMGFTAIFVAMGATATSLGTFLNRNRIILERGAGIVVIVMGLFLSGLVKIPILKRDARLRLKGRNPASLPFLFGVSFSLGWSPCMGPVLAAVLLYASAGGTVFRGMALLGVFSAGLMMMFVISGVIFVYFVSFFESMKKAIPVLKQVSALFLIVMGLIMVI